MKTISICLLVALLPWTYAAKFVGILEASPIEEDGKRKTVGLEDAEKFFLPIPDKKPLHHKPDHDPTHHDDQHDHDDPDLHEPDHHDPHHQEDHHDIDPHKPDDHDVPDGHEQHDGHKPKPDVLHKPFKPGFFFNPFLPFLQNSLKPISHVEDSQDHHPQTPDHLHGDQKPHHVKPDHLGNSHPHAPHDHGDHHSDGSDHHDDSHLHEPDHGDKPIVKPSFDSFYGLEGHKKEFFESWFKFWSHFVSSFKPPFHTGRPLVIHHYHHYVHPTHPDHAEADNHPVSVQHPEDHPSETYQVGYPSGGFHYDIHHIPGHFYPNPQFPGFPPPGFPYFPQRPLQPIPQIPSHHFLPQPFKGPDDPNYSNDKDKNKVPLKNELSDSGDNIKEPSDDSVNTTPRSAENHFTIGYYHYKPSPLPQYLTTTDSSHKPDDHHVSPPEEDDHQDHEIQQKPEPPYSPFSQIFPQIFWPFTAKPSTKRAKKDK
ncbi:hypothetical protein J6590_070970 [Homalodisca vitripennis]|nr:hypothetical protein J6590_070970 [Homalodisca vitripennis]